MYSIVKTPFPHACRLLLPSQRDLRSSERSPDDPFQNHGPGTRTQHTPSPLVGKLADRRPDGVLVLPVLVKVGHLGGISRGVSMCLALLVLLVAGDIAEEDVICYWAEEEDGVEERVGVEDQGERRVDQDIAEIAGR